ncbi:hypothetical protein Y032_0238g3279 [Ancylostoma ceylanicum]|nr:hypothetical protein Y032_0238g3279 [Ancylostoma ceylanicum]
MANVIFFAAAACLARSVVADVQPVYALDIATPLSEFDARCLKMCRYSTVFLRAYSPFVSGGFEASVCGSVKNAQRAGFGIELYMIPLAPNLQDGALQFDSLYNGLKGCQVLVKRIWLVVTSPREWLYNPPQSVGFINKVINRAKQYGIDVGIYTNEDDWGQITNGFMGFTTTPLLWYWKVNGPGPMGETPMNFQDFRPFASWKGPTVKQFGQRVFVCGHMTNRDTYFANIRQTFANTASNGNVSYVGYDTFQ